MAYSKSKATPWAVVPGLPSWNHAVGSGPGSPFLTGPASDLQRSNFPVDYRVRLKVSHFSVYVISIDLLPSGSRHSHSLPKSNTGAENEEFRRHPRLTGTAPRGGHLSGRSLGEDRRRLGVLLDVGELCFALRSVRSRMSAVVHGLSRTKEEEAVLCVYFLGILRAIVAL